MVRFNTTNMDCNIYYQNTRSILDKTDVKVNISASSHNIVALTETWLNDSTPSSLYFDSSFIVERSDRKRSRGGGCLIAYKHSITAHRINEWENEFGFENVWLAMNSGNPSKKNFINVCYIPPNTPYTIYKHYFDVLIDKLCCIEPGSDFIILGDFNISNIEWTTDANSVIPLIRRSHRK